MNHRVRQPRPQRAAARGRGQQRADLIGVHHIVEDEERPFALPSATQRVRHFGGHLAGAARLRVGAGHLHQELSGREAVAYEMGDMVGERGLAYAGRTGQQHGDRFMAVAAGDGGCAFTGRAAETTA